MSRLISINSVSDIPAQYHNTPIELFLKYHNLGYEYQSYDRAQLLVGMCMDNRKSLKIPDNFAYVLRTGGGNLRYSEFKVSYAIAVGGIKAIALIVHNNCGMVNLNSRRGQFITGLVENAGWNKEQAEEHFSQFALMFELGNEIDFVISEAARLRKKYPKILVAPLYYQLEDNQLFLVEENA